ncbi:MAG: Ig domain-containing protein, partial [Candidatus Thiodiazotropha sp.]
MSVSQYLQPLRAFIISLPLVFNLAAAQSLETAGSGDCQADVHRSVSVNEAKRSVTARKHSCNTGLQIISTPVLTAQVGVAYRYDVDATNADDDPIAYSLKSFPAGMRIDSESGLITWTPSETQIGQHRVTVRAVDDAGQRDYQRYTLKVTDASPANQAPQITSEPVTGGTENQAYQYDVDATDPNTGDSLSYSLTTAPAGMAIDSATGLITWVPG